VTYAAVRGQVNVVDFVGLEAVRIFLPTLYDSIRSNPEMFGASRDLAAAFRATQADELARFHQKWADPQAIGENKLEAAKELAGWLFPQTAQPLGIHIRRSHTAFESRRCRHVSDPDFYPLYFRLTLGDTAISRDLVTAMVNRSADPDAFCEALIALAGETNASGRTRASVMLDELVGQTDRFDAAGIPELIASLLSMGDRLWIESDEQFLSAGNDLRIWWLIERLLGRIDNEERGPVLARGIDQARSIATPVRVVVALGRWFGLDGGSIRDANVAEGLEQSALVDSATLLQLETSAARRIKRSAQDGQLFGVPSAPWVLARWACWSTADEVREWLNGVRSDDEQLGRLLVAFLHSSQTRTGEIKHRLNPRWFEQYTDLDEFANDVRHLQPSASGDVAVAVAQFLAELEILASGRDPDWSV
jgi:predicted KAP-like P-loop ATPase